MAVSDREMNALNVFAFLEKIRARYRSEDRYTFDAVLEEQMVRLAYTTAIYNSIVADVCLSLTGNHS